jgi:hypothetical protein
MITKVFHLKVLSNWLIHITTIRKVNIPKPPDWHWHVLTPCRSDSEAYHFVDPKALDCKVTSSADTPSRLGFFNRIIQRDRLCVVSLEGPEVSEAVHIIPFNKGDEVCINVLTCCINA